MKNKKMKLKLYQHQIRTNKIISIDNKITQNIFYDDYIFIVENDINNEYYIETKYNYKDKKSYIQLSIRKEKNNITKEWTINRLSQVYRRVYREYEVKKLDYLFDCYIYQEKQKHRTKKIVTIIN